MTVVAWDGVTLAADKMSTAGYAKRRVRKLFKGRWLDGREMLFAGCGDQAFAVRVMSWLADVTAGKTDSPRPDYKDFDVAKDACIGLVILRSAEGFSYVHTMTPLLDLTPFEENIFAQGCGHEAAWGALEAGATAVQAVEIASRRIAHCGLGVDAITFDS